MKSYGGLKPEMETIQEQVVETKKNERTNSLKKVNHVYKKFDFIAEMLKGSLAEGCGEK